MDSIATYYHDFKEREARSRGLMKKRIRRILLVSSYYEAFIFEQEGRLVEQVKEEFSQLNLSTAPVIECIPETDAAIELLKHEHFDVVIIMMSIGREVVLTLSHSIKEQKPWIPVILLLSSQEDYELMQRDPSTFAAFEEVYLWTGNSRLFLAIIKILEDRLNLAFDVKHANCRVILLVEDSVHYYSLFLPLLYSEILKQTQRLIDEEVSDTQKYWRMLARPKVILAKNYEQAYEAYLTYRDYLLLILTDSKFPQNGKQNPFAGVNLLKEILSNGNHPPLIIQSADPEILQKVENLPITYFSKNSESLLTDLKDYFTRYLGFGDFYFRDNNENILDKAVNVHDFETKLRLIPEESLLYHSEGNHFSSWLIAHNETEIAKIIQPLEIGDFENTQALREYLIATFRKVRLEKNKGQITGFDADNLNDPNQVCRLGLGSLGGKGRGLAFINALMASADFGNKFKEINIFLPNTSIIGTGEFDRFVEEHSLEKRVIGLSDQEIDELFQTCPFGGELTARLQLFLQKVRTPLAVRSSGLLEDNLTHPFAGIYKTYLLPNNQEKFQLRYEELVKAIRYVYASLFHNEVRQYIKNSSYNLEDEKMAVILQSVAGRVRGDYYFPDISGVAQSYNFYPAATMAQEDGIINLALGLGKAVVERHQTFSFCPRYPQIEIFPKAEIVRNMQQHFWALNLNKNSRVTADEDSTLVRLDLTSERLEDFFVPVTSVWDWENNNFIDSFYATGPKVISYRNFTVYRQPPLSDFLQHLLEVGRKAFGTPVEIEFALNLPEPGKAADFYFLQIRPLALKHNETNIDIVSEEVAEAIVYTESALGNGIFENISDIVFYHKDDFENLRTNFMKAEIEKLNADLVKEGKKYILLGPGRWGSSDSFLGIPIKWAQISNAKIIVEVIKENSQVEASNGSHFFHNLIALRVGYFICLLAKGAVLDREWLLQQPKRTQGEYFSHISLKDSLLVKIDGRKGKGIIRKK